MNKFVENVLKLINSGKDILTISSFFGGLTEFFNLIKKFPTLEKLVRQKLSGDFLYKPESEDWMNRGEYIDIGINVVDIETDSSDEDYDFKNLNIGLNIQLPKITDKHDLARVAYFINDLLVYGDGYEDDVLIDERDFIFKGNWYGMYHVSSINDIPFSSFTYYYKIHEEDFINIVTK